MQSYASCAGMVGVESAPWALVKEAANSDTLAQTSTLPWLELDAGALVDAEPLEDSEALGVTVALGSDIGYDDAPVLVLWFHGHFGG